MPTDQWRTIWPGTGPGGPGGSGVTTSGGGSTGGFWGNVFGQLGRAAITGITGGLTAGIAGRLGSKVGGSNPNAVYYAAPGAAAGAQQAYATQQGLSEGQQREFSSSMQGRSLAHDASERAKQRLHERNQLNLEMCHRRLSNDGNNSEGQINPLLDWAMNANPGKIPPGFGRGTPESLLDARINRYPGER